MRGDEYIILDRSKTCTDIFRQWFDPVNEYYPRFDQCEKLSMIEISQ